MSMKKWIRLFENSDLCPGCTVKITDSRGGGTGIFKSFSDNDDIVIIDIKGQPREYSISDITPILDTDRDYGELPTNIVAPVEMFSGDSVIVKDLYGAGTGDGHGVFVAYSTDGNTAIVNVDSEERSFPVDLVYPAKNEISYKGTGDLSPMSLANKEKDCNMNIKDYNWMNVSESEELEGDESCDCGEYDCTTCYPLEEEEENFIVDESDDEVEEIEEDTANDVQMSAYGYDDMEIGEMIGRIDYMQNLGMSNTETYYSMDTLLKLPRSKVESIYSRVMGEDEPMLETSAGGVAVGGGDQGKVEDEDGIYEDDITESQRLKKTVGMDNNYAKIYWDSDWEEYVVKFYRDGLYKENEDYFTDSLDDAEATADKVVSMTNGKEVLSELDAELECDDECHEDDAQLNEQKDVECSESGIRVVQIDNEYEFDIAARNTNWKKIGVDMNMGGVFVVFDHNKNSKYLVSRRDGIAYDASGSEHSIQDIPGSSCFLTESEDLLVLKKLSGLA